MPKGHGRGKKFKKGDNGNPLGGKLHNPEKRRLKKLLKEEFSMTIEMVTQSTLKELQDLIKDPNSSMDKVIMASALINGAKKGDVSQLIQLAEIVIGKPKETHEHRVVNPYEGMTPEQLKLKQKEFDALLESPKIESLKDVTPGSITTSDREIKS